MTISYEHDRKLNELMGLCPQYEGKYNIRLLYKYLSESSNAKDDIAKQLISLLEKIHDLKKASKFSDKIKAINAISADYQNLVKSVGSDGVVYNTREILLGFGRYILAAIFIPFGGVVGFIALGIRDIKEKNIPSGAISGAIAGCLVSATLGYRLLDRVLKKREDLFLEHAVSKLSMTFDSLFASVGVDSLDDLDSLERKIQHEILVDNFSSNQQAFNEFLQGRQTYNVLCKQASFFDNKLKGFLGHHSFIKFNVNNTGEAKLIELGARSTEIDFSQVETRHTTGRQLIKMLAMHELMQRFYKAPAEDVFNFLQRYEAGVTDCHTYVDKILQSVGEPPSKLQRFTCKDTVVGRYIGRMFKFLSPQPEAILTNTGDEKNLKV